METLEQSKENIEELKKTRTQYKKDLSKKNKKKQKQRILKAGFIILILLISFIIINRLIILPLLKVDKPVSVLLVGSDIDEYRSTRYGGTKPEKTDALMVSTFNPETLKVVSTSIPRDTAIDYACKDMRGKVNEIYATSGSMDCLVDSISYYLNVPIDYYIKVNMDQIEEIINEIGPLSITAYAIDGYLSQSNVDGTQTYEWYAGQTYQMNADEVLTYVRARHDSERDYGRGIRQQQVVEALLEGIVAQGIDIGLIKNIFQTTETNIPMISIPGYTRHLKEANDLYQLLTNEETLKKGDISSKIWKELQEYFEYKGNIESFKDYLLKNYTSEEIKGYFIQGYQFYNNTYNGYYITPEDQLREVSNALRTNLELSEKDPKEMTKDFGVNTFAKETIFGSSSETLYTDTYQDNEGNEKIVNDETSDTTVEEEISEDEISEGDNTENKEPDKEPDIDTDQDGLTDQEELELGTDPQVADTDGDGILDGEDEDPLNYSDVQGGDIDGDGLTDQEETELGTNMYMPDTDGDGILDGEDEDPLNASENIEQ